MSINWQPIVIDKSFIDDPRAWLTAHVSEEMPWILIHADDGVIWGKRQGGSQVLLSSDVFNDASVYPSIAVPLRAETMQQMRIFGPKAELLIWRNDSDFAARSLGDAGIEAKNLIEESFLLWQLGEPIEIRLEQGYALLHEGKQGQLHALPIIPSSPKRPRLYIKHYIDYDNMGQAYIAASRLAKLEA